MEIRAPAPNCFLGLYVLGHSRVLLAPVRPVGHQAAYSAIVVGILLFARLLPQRYFLAGCKFWLVI